MPRRTMRYHSLIVEPLTKVARRTASYRASDPGNEGRLMSVVGVEPVRLRSFPLAMSLQILRLTCLGSIRAITLPQCITATRT